MTRFAWGAASDTGRVRQANEDSFLVVDGLFAVADGMGGHQAGEVASHLALESLQSGFTAAGTDVLVRAVEDANRILVERSTTDPELALVVRLHVGAALGDHISTDQGLIERLAVSLPIAQIARLKSQVQRPPIRRPGDDRVGQRRRQRTAHENSRQQRCQTRRTEELHAPSLGGAFHKASPIALSEQFASRRCRGSRCAVRSTRGAGESPPAGRVG